MKKIILTICILLFITGSFSACDNAEAPKEMYYFYEEICSSCNPQAEFYQMAKTKTSGISDIDVNEIICVNTFLDGKDRFSEVCDKYGIPKEDRLFPMLVTSSGYVTGEEAIQSRLRSLICETYDIEDTKTVWYYQRPDCPDCARVKPIIEKAFEENPDYSLIVIDTNDEEEKTAFKELLIEMDIPQEEWQVPFIYNGKDYLSGDTDIEEGLDSFLS